MDSLGIDWVVHPVFGIVFADDQEFDWLAGVVDERVGDSSARRKGNRVTSNQLAQVAVDPEAGTSRHYENELFVGTVRVWHRGAATWKDRLVVHTDPLESKVPAKRRGDISVPTLAALDPKLLDRANEWKLVGTLGHVATSLPRIDGKAAQRLVMRQARRRGHKKPR
jgi:hypothetical protein